MYVPYGRAAAHIFIRDDKTPSGCATMLAFQIVAVELASAISVPAWSASLHANKAYHKTKLEKCWATASVDLTTLEKKVSDTLS